MPFREFSGMEQRIAMLRAYETGAFTVSELSERFGISRETFYVWKRRRAAGLERWYEDLSHAPVHCRHGVAEDVVEAIVTLRHRFPRFGPKKLLAVLRMEAPQMAWPAASTIGEVLKRRGLIEPRRRRRLRQGSAVFGSDRPNQEWAMDFKGWFRTGDGVRCDPLTVSDTASRYLIAVRIVPPSHEGVRSALEPVFWEIGLPDAMRSDNGTPFGCSGPGGLSRLSVWLLKLGIEPRFIPPGSPQDNGRHERMHREMKAETARAPAATKEAQQERFEGFRRHYNEERPHEALGQTMPATHWRRPERRMPARLEEPWYDADHQVRRVRGSGEIRWKGEYVFIGEALAGEPVGVAERESGGYLVRFCSRDLGLIDRNGRFHRFAPPRARLRSAVEAPAPK